MKPSSFVFKFIKESNSKKVMCLYISHKLKKIYFEGEKEINLINNILKNPSKYKNHKFTKLLIKNNFLIKDTFSINDELKSILEEVNKKPKLDVFYFLPTMACNFRCKYCFVEGGKNYKPIRMNNETFKNSLNIILKALSINKNKTKKLVVYGGEPLLMKNMVFRLFKEVSNLETKEGINIQKIIITNGSIINDEIINLIKKYNIRLAVSCDGPKEIHNKNRVDSSGKPTFEIVSKNINRLKEEGVEYTISTTITNENVDNLPDIVEYLIKTFKPIAIGLNLLIGYEFNKDIQSLAKKTSKKIIESYKICRKYGVYEDTMLRKVLNFINETPYIYNCAATGGQLVIDPEGNLGLCHAFYGNKTFFPMNLNNIKRVDQIRENPLFLEWKKRTPFKMKDCLTCPALGICGGGCPYNAYLNKGTIFGLDEFYCVHAKETLKWLIWEQYEQRKKETREETTN